MFDDRYVIDNFSLVLKALFLLTGYIVVLLSTHEIEEGGYHQGEYYVMLLSSILGMVMMSSARDLISVFIALEFLSIPAYMMAAWRKRDRKSNEAGVKYFLLGVFASAVMLYGMSLLYGATGSTKLTAIGQVVTGKGKLGGIEVMGVVFVIVGFAFKVSAVPFHTWAPDTYEGAPTPVTAFLSVASKAAGFVALVLMVYLAFPHATDVYRPFIWVLSALTMTVGNVLALRQTNIVRLLAYSSISQGGFILMPLGRRRFGSFRRDVAAGDRALPDHLRGHQPRRVCRRHRRQPQDAQRRDLQLRWPVRLRARVGRADDASSSRRLPASRRSAGGTPSSVCSMRCLTARQRVGLQHRRDRRGQRRDRHCVLRHDHARDVDEAGARWRHHAGAGSRLDQGRAGHHRRRHRWCSACCPA